MRVWSQKVPLCLLYLLYWSCTHHSHLDQKTLRECLSQGRANSAQLCAYEDSELQAEPGSLISSDNIQHVPGPRFLPFYEGRIGLFCLPTNPTLKSHILSISNTQRKYNLFKVMDTFFMCAWLSAILGIILFVLIQYQPEKIVPWSIFLGGICSILFGFFVLTYKWVKVVFLDILWSKSFCVSY